MMYIKIFDENAMLLGVVNVSDFQQISEGNRHIKTSNENLLLNGVTNVDEEISSSEEKRLITLYNEKMIPIGVIDLGDFYYNSLIGDLDENQGGQTKKGGSE